MIKKYIFLISSIIFITQTSLAESRSFIEKANGFSGEIKLEIKTKGDQIEDIILLSHNETAPVFTRAFPILKERILEAQSPIVDSVSGATITSTAIKRAVNETYKELGRDFGRITPRTKGPVLPDVLLPAVSTDLVIIGGGPSGLAAAITAKESGLKNVILIEKMDMLSGNGKFDMNFYDLIDSQAQRDKGIEDSAEKFIIESKNKMDSPEKVVAQAYGAAKLDPWLRGMGTKLNHHYGKRGHMAEKNLYAGEVIQDNMELRAKELGVDIRPSTKGLDLKFNENGEAVGVKVQNKNKFYDIDAKAVIVATGGFSANKSLLAKHAPGTQLLQHSNQIGATGDFIPVFEKHDIALENLDVINIFPFILGKTRDLAGPTGGSFILVNTKGKRFTSENITLDKRVSTARKMMSQPEGKTFYVFDQNLYDSSYRLQKHTAKGYHIVGENLDDLAEKMGVPKEALKETVANFNKSVKGEIKDPFREVPSKVSLKEEGPYYAVLVESAIHMTRGGVVTNENTEVLNNEGEIVQGLFASGEVTSTNGAYSASVVFGRIAGENAAEFINSK